MKNVLWVDPRSKATHKYFRDVITFNTTYLTNKYDMSFAPFVRVNHNGQYFVRMRIDFTREYGDIYVVIMYKLINLELKYSHILLFLIISKFYINFLFILFTAFKLKCYK